MIGMNEMNRYYFLVFILTICMLVGCKEKTVINEVSDNAIIVKTDMKDESIEPKNEAVEETHEESFESFEFDIDIGNGIHKFKVVMQVKPFQDGMDDIFYDSELMISIYDRDNLTTPVQELVNKTNGTLFFTNEVLDANFDGYSDFSYVAWRGANNASSNFFLWDNDEMCFVFSEELSELSLPSFDNDLEVVSEFNKSGATSNFTRFYRFYDDDLICIRGLYMGSSDEEGTLLLRVEDLKQGELVEVFNKKASLDDSEEAFVGEVYDEFFLWMNIEYSGE